METHIYTADMKPTHIYQPNGTSATGEVVVVFRRSLPPTHDRQPGGCEYLHLHLDAATMQLINTFAGLCPQA